MLPDPSVAPPLRRTRSANAAASNPPLLLPIPPPRPQQRAFEAALYWDYENMPIGKHFTETALKTLLSRARTFGNLLECRLYADSCKATLNPKHRAALENAGITLIDCPTSNKKEAVDKKIILDTLFFALPRATRQTPCSVILISSDGDFAHMLSRLESVGVRTIAIGSSSALRAVSQTSLSLSEACGTSNDGGSGSGASSSERASASSAPAAGAAGKAAVMPRGAAGKAGRGRAARAPVAPTDGPALGTKGRKRGRNDTPTAALPTPPPLSAKRRKAGGPAKAPAKAKAKAGGGASPSMKSIKKRKNKSARRSSTKSTGGDANKAWTPPKRRRASKA